MTRRPLCRAFQVRIIATAAIALVLSAGPLQAAEERPGAWGVIDLSAPLGDRSPSGASGAWSVAADLQARYFDIGTGISQWLLRPSVGYRFTNGLEIRLGYGRFRVRSRSGEVVNEDRPYQDLNLLLGQPLAGNLDLRARVEQRFLDISSEVSHVVRARLRFRRPVGNTASIEAHYEGFYTLNDADWAGSSRLVQWRLYAGVGRPVGPVRIALGYMYQFFDGEDETDIANHLAVLRVGYRFGQ